MRHRLTICNLAHLHTVDNLPPATPERDNGNKRWELDWMIKMNLTKKYMFFPVNPPLSITHLCFFLVTKTYKTGVLLSQTQNARKHKTQGWYQITKRKMTFTTNNPESVDNDNIRQSERALLL